jgi:hypothetical protein
LQIILPRFCDIAKLEAELTGMGILRDVHYEGITTYAHSPDDPDKPLTIVHGFASLNQSDILLIRAMVGAHNP